MIITKEKSKKEITRTNLSILLVEDDLSLREEILIFLKKKFSTVYSAENGKEGLEMFMKLSPELVISDIKMPVMNGLEMIEQIKAESPHTPVIVNTAFSEVAYLIKAIEIGVDRLIQKPLERKKLMEAITRCAKPILQEKEIRCLNEQLDSSLEEHLGKSKSMKALFTRARQLASSNFSLILQGETGVGKSHIARLIHKMSKRSAHPFVTVDIGAIPEALVESELFGHKKGAFTGAVADKKGFFETAHEATIFLDELENLTPYVQAKLLRAVEDKKILPLGSTTPVDVDVRIIAATNKALESEVMEKRFREDLFYRLNDFTINIPPLRGRAEDIAILSRRFMVEAAEELDKNVTGITHQALEILEKHDWPGNIRELKSTIRRVMFFCSSDKINEEELLQALNSKESMRMPQAETNPLSHPESLTVLSMDELEKWGIENALRQTGGKKMEAAVLLKIGYSTLKRKMKLYNIGD
ncbi:MAG: sigma-54-dependent Fis family transcriptional regulator [bacterium]|nr:sigma-54-dependent Fis family transcriptional regulator [bacterium]